MPPKKEKTGGRSVDYVYLQRKKVFWPDDIGHSAKQKTQAIYPDILLVFIVELAKI